MDNNQCTKKCEIKCTSKACMCLGCFDSCPKNSPEARESAREIPDPDVMEALKSSLAWRHKVIKKARR